MPTLLLGDGAESAEGDVVIGNVFTGSERGGVFIGSGEGDVFIGSKGGDVFIGSGGDDVFIDDGVGNEVGDEDVKEQPRQSSPQRNFRVHTRLNKDRIWISNPVSIAIVKSVHVS